MPKNTSKTMLDTSVSLQWGDLHQPVSDAIFNHNQGAPIEAKTYY